jgi:hypothetical protein
MAIDPMGRHRWESFEHRATTGGFGGRMISSGSGRRASIGPSAAAVPPRGRRRALPLAAGVVVAAALTVSTSEPAPAGWATVGDNETTTPIKHLVVLFQENVPFDRYFGVYPHALNPPGEPRFDPTPATPAVDGLTHTLLTANPNAAAPHRLDRTQPGVCGSNHGYTAEQRAVDHGRMDRFVQETGNHAPGSDAPTAAPSATRRRPTATASPGSGTGIPRRRPRNAADHGHSAPAPSSRTTGSSGASGTAPSTSSPDH